MAETSFCMKCKKDLPVSEFYFRKEKNAYRGCCKKCKSVNTKDEIAARLLSETKICKHCGVEKPISEYQKAAYGFQPYCKPCDSFRKKEWYVKNRQKQLAKGAEKYKKKIEENPDFHKEYYQKNREKILERNKTQSKKYRDKINERNSRYRKLDKYRSRATNRAREKAKEDPDYFKKIYQQRKDSINRKGKREEYNAKQREFKRKHPDRYKNYQLSDWAKENRKIRNREWSRNKTETDIAYRIGKNIRSRTRFALKRWNTKKCASTERLLGCSIQQFKEYFCSLFTNGMSWEMFMKGEIHIDHIKPCIRFNLSEPEEQMACFHYSNLQPLWWRDNLKKGSSYEEKNMELCQK